MKRTESKRTIDGVVGDGMLPEDKRDDELAMKVQNAMLVDTRRDKQKEIIRDLQTRLAFYRSWWRMWTPEDGRPIPYARLLMDWYTFHADKSFSDFTMILNELTTLNGARYSTKVLRVYEKCVRRIVKRIRSKKLPHLISFREEDVSDDDKNKCSQWLFALLSSHYTVDQIYHHVLEGDARPTFAVPLSIKSLEVVRQMFCSFYALGEYSVFRSEQEWEKKRENTSEDELFNEQYEEKDMLEVRQIEREIEREIKREIEREIEEDIEEEDRKRKKKKEETKRTEEEKEAAEKMFWEQMDFAERFSGFHHFQDHLLKFLHSNRLERLQSISDYFIAEYVSACSRKEKKNENPEKVDRWICDLEPFVDICELQIDVRKVIQSMTSFQGDTSQYFDIASCLYALFTEWSVRHVEGCDGGLDMYLEKKCRKKWTMDVQRTFYMVPKNPMYAFGQELKRDRDEEYFMAVRFPCRDFEKGNIVLRAGEIERHKLQIRNPVPEFVWYTMHSVIRKKKISQHQFLQTMEPHVQRGKNQHRTNLLRSMFCMNQIWIWETSVYHSYYSKFLESHFDKVVSFLMNYDSSEFKYLTSVVIDTETAEPVSSLRDMEDLQLEEPGNSSVIFGTTERFCTLLEHSLRVQVYRNATLTAEEARPDMLFPRIRYLFTTSSKKEIYLTPFIFECIVNWSAGNFLYVRRFKTKKFEELFGKWLNVSGSLLHFRSVRQLYRMLGDLHRFLTTPVWAEEESQTDRQEIEREWTSIRSALIRKRNMMLQNVHWKNIPLMYLVLCDSNSNDMLYSSFREGVLDVENRGQYRVVDVRTGNPVEHHLPDYLFGV